MLYFANFLAAMGLLDMENMDVETSYKLIYFESAGKFK